MREFNGKPHILEQALPVDYAFLRAYRADRLGNVEMRGSSRNFVPSLRQGGQRRHRRSRRDRRGRRDPGRTRRPARHPRLARRQEDRRARPGAASPRAAPPTSRASTTASPAGRGTRWRDAPPALLDEGSYVNLGDGHPDAGLELHRRPRHHPARRKRHPGLRPAWSSGDAIDHGHLQRLGPVRRRRCQAPRSSTASTSFEMARGGKL